MSASITLDMSTDAREFHRLLMAFCASGSMHCDVPDKTGCWRVHTDDGVVTICLHPQPARRVGALALPRALVRLDLAALPAARRAAFLARFRRHFHRGGG